MKGTLIPDQEPPSSLFAWAATLYEEAACAQQPTHNHRLAFARLLVERRFDAVARTGKFVLLLSYAQMGERFIISIGLTERSQ